MKELSSQQNKQTDILSTRIHYNSIKILYNPTKIHYKLTITCSLPLGSYYIPIHMYKDLAIAAVTRVIRKTSSPSICNLYINHQTPLWYSNSRTSFHPLKYILNRRWKITHNDFRFLTLPPYAPPLIYTNRQKT